MLESPGIPTLDDPEAASDQTAELILSTITPTIIPISNITHEDCDSSVGSPGFWDSESGINSEGVMSRFPSGDWPFEDHLGVPTDFSMKGRDWDRVDFEVEYRQQSSSPLTRNISKESVWATGSSFNSPELLPVSPETAHGKRSASVSDIISEAEQDDSRKRARRTHQVSSKQASSKRRFACPFFRRDPQHYQECGKYILKRIKDVRQHIYRHHCTPEISCPRCFKSFKDKTELNKHIRGDVCPVKDVPTTDDKLSKDTERKLKMRDPGTRGMDEQQQWMKLWEVIFPDDSLSRSPYIKNDQAELFSCIRDTWENNAEDVSTRVLGNLHSKALGTTQIRQVIDSFLDYIETKMPSQNCD
ncbi:hypothetical protein F5Y08DRAFT_350174 [Xylaria arbuscula]|nr:hypothetical protein F5Y08DRAFT_350174 [Xylaria arbuscula]